MSNEKRVIQFVLLAMASILAVDYLMRATGIIPPPPEPQAEAKGKLEPGKDKAKDKNAPPAVAKADEKGADKSKDATGKTADAKDKPKEADKLKEPRVALAKPEEMILGSTKNEGPAGYRLQVVLDQKGGGVSSLASSQYEAEFEEGKARKRPLQLLHYDPLAPPSLSLTLQPPKLSTPDEAKAAGVVDAGELALDAVVWEVVRDDQGRAVRPITKFVSLPEAPSMKSKVDGQELVLRTVVDELGLTITRTYRLYKGDDAFDMELAFTSPEKTNRVSYRLLGPHGVPIEGEWYTGTFREAIFGQVSGRETKVATLPAYDVVKHRTQPERFQTLPLKYAGIENQYFAAFVAPKPAPVTDTDRLDSESLAIVLHDNPESTQKADIAVEILSKPLEVGPNAPVTHTFAVFAGPKTMDALAPYGAEDLATYRKSNWIPFASFFARAIITPLLSFTYAVTERVAKLFGSSRGNYGVAIILLTLIVRLAMFPLGRKAAMAAKAMQDLQPYLKEIQEKYKDDKEAQTRETFALYKKHGVNPVGGCLPALIQLPIFVGLWQALNNSVYLRHANFLWIENLAAPDMLFKLPFNVIGLGDWFNLLPFLVVTLMLIQTKLFSPPATTPEAEMQQKTMKFMMVFMAFMFYKVPSGLGIYFITSSLWQIGERLLLPKVTHAPAAKAAVSDDAPAAKPKKQGAISQFLERVMEEASKDPTYRKIVDERNSKDKDKDSTDGNGGRDKGNRPGRAKPGRRR